MVNLLHQAVHKAGAARHWWNGQDFASMKSPHVHVAIFQSIQSLAV